MNDEEGTTFCDTIDEAGAGVLSGPLLTNYRHHVD